MCSRIFKRNFEKKLQTLKFFKAKMRMRVVWLLFLGVNCSENIPGNKTEEELDEGSTEMD